MTNSEQFCLLPERSDQRPSALHRAQMSAGAMLEIAEVTSTEVRHGVMLEVTPDVFDGVELGSVGRQILQGDAAVESVEVLLNQPRAMRLQAIPHDQQLLADGPLQGLEELHHLQALDRSGNAAKVEPPEAHPGDHRELLPGEAVLQYRGLPSGGPGACAAGSLGQTRFVDEDDYSPLPRCDFFIAGHLFSFQVRMAASSPSRARPVGRCTLQPSCCSVRQTEDCENSTPKRSLISIPMRGSVHSSLVKPAASAPAFNALINSARCASSSLGGRPKRFGRCSAAIPPLACSLLQRSTDCRDTPTRRATSAGQTSAANSRMPRLRRCSSSFNCCSISIATWNVTTRGPWTASVGKSVMHLRNSQSFSFLGTNRLSR